MVQFSPQDVGLSRRNATTSSITLSHFGAEVDLTRTYDQEGKYKRGDKPRGLWLSDESDYGWSEWCRQEEFVDTDAQLRTDFRIRPDANVLHLDTPQAILDFTDEWGFRPEWAATNAWISNVWDIDWPKIAELYDGILITPYQPAYHLEVRWYYSWDVASACVWNLDCLERVS